jgi:hypothetical protein
MQERQIEFPPEQTHVKWITPAMFLLSAICIAVVIILLVAEVDGPFVGPW